MDFVAVLDQVIALLRQRGRLTYRTLQVQFQLDDEALAASRTNSSMPNAGGDEDEHILVWTVRRPAPLPLPSPSVAARLSACHASGGAPAEATASLPRRNAANSP